MLSIMSAGIDRSAALSQFRVLRDGVWPLSDGSRVRDRPGPAQGAGRALWARTRQLLNSEEVLRGSDE